MSKKKLVSILLSAVLCFGMLGSTFSASAAYVSVHLTLLAAGREIDEAHAIKTERLDYETDWFLKLNPQGAGTKDCDAWGYMKNA